MLAEPVLKNYLYNYTCYDKIIEFVVYTHND